MMRRTVLLLATTVLALIAAGGIALAATPITCTINPCDGTTDDDQITGTVNAETINGKAGNDEIFARDANDTLNGDEGNDTMHGELGDDGLNGGDGTDQLFGDNGRDRLNGGAGNDTLDGGPETADVSSCSDYYATNCSDTYFFTPNWGNDTIIEGLGRGAIVAESATAAAMPNLTVNLVSDPSRPEVSDGNGNTMNWENNDVYHAVTGAGDDVISQNPLYRNGMNGGAGNDTYTGYVPGVRNGGDDISDQSGTADVIDLSNMRLADVTFTAPRFSTNIEYLQIKFTPRIDACDYSDNCNFAEFYRYFDNTSPNVCASGPGPGLIETIKFADDPSVDFQQVRSLLGCPPPDTTAPDTSITSGPNGPTNNTAPTFTFTGSDSRTTTANLKYQYQLDSGGWSSASTSTTANLTGLSEGAHLFEVRAVDEAGNVDANPAQRSFTVDTTAPKVNTVSPTDPTIPARSTDVEANFSEKVASSSINTSTFKLFKCTSTTSTNCANQVTNAPVSLSTDGLKATLNPSTLLGSRTKYKAVLTTGVTDEAGNALNQQTVWYFTTGRT
jgi:Ca2+-binding RTX toxin-like protein